MHVALRCPCGANLKAPIKSVGRELKCPKCATLLVVPEPPMAQTRSEPTELEVLEPFEMPVTTQPHVMPAAPAASVPKFQKKPKSSKTKARWPILIAIAGVLVMIFGGVLFYTYKATDTGSRNLVLPEGVKAGDLSERKHVPRGKQPPAEKNALDSGVAKLPSNSENVLDEDLGMRDLIKSVEPSIVRINVEMFDGSEKIGSGFFVDTEGKIFTNNHVIRGASVMTVETADGKTAPVIGFLIASKERDLAIIQIDPSKLNCVPLAIAQQLPEKGDSIVAFGNPQGFSFSQTEGTVSSVRPGKEVRAILNEMAPGANIYERKGFTDDMTWIQHSASISGGNSGGPLVNMRGEMVGVNTWTHEQGQNLNFASTMDEVERVFADRKGMLLKFQGLTAGSTSSITGQ